MIYDYDLGDAIEKQVSGFGLSGFDHRWRIRLGHGSAAAGAGIGRQGSKRMAR